MKFKLPSITKNLFIFISISILLISCKDVKKTEEEVKTNTEAAVPFFKLSLAQWSLNKAVRFEGANPFDFAEKARVN